jgi:hypothetical protein
LVQDVPAERGASEMQLSSAWNETNVADLNINMIDVAHELGHAAGVNHVNLNSSCGDTATTIGGTTFAAKSVMLTGNFGGQWWAYLNCNGVRPPYVDDRNGVNAAYPGGN